MMYLQKPFTAFLNILRILEIFVLVLPLRWGFHIYSETSHSVSKITTQLGKSYYFMRLKLKISVNDN